VTIILQHGLLPIAREHQEERVPRRAPVPPVLVAELDDLTSQKSKSQLEDEGRLRALLSAGSSLWLRQMCGSCGLGPTSIATSAFWHPMQLGQSDQAHNTSIGPSRKMPSGSASAG
jgi:hypothetical protein